MGVNAIIKYKIVPITLNAFFIINIRLRPTVDRKKYLLLLLQP